VTCEAPLTLCNGSCIDVASDVNHCGMCGKPCAQNQTCSQSQCVANSTMQNGGLNVAELEKLLARFDVTLEQFTNALGVTREQLARTHVTLSDIVKLGVTREQLTRAGITLDDLARIGVDITA
jgi:hypothetical protein